MHWLTSLVQRSLHFLTQYVWRWVWKGAFLSAVTSFFELYIRNKTDDRWCCYSQIIHAGVVWYSSKWNIVVFRHLRENLKVLVRIIIIYIEVIVLEYYQLSYVLKQLVFILCYVNDTCNGHKILFVCFETYSISYNNDKLCPP